ncbi:hypothetical protein ACVILH_001300 [Bradyrhizobium sp. USDA 4353]
MAMRKHEFRNYESENFAPGWAIELIGLTAQAK